MERGVIEVQIVLSVLLLGGAGLLFYLGCHLRRENDRLAGALRSPRLRVFASREIVAGLLPLVGALVFAPLWAQLSEEAVSSGIPPGWFLPEASGAVRDIPSRPEAAPPLTARAVVPVQAVPAYTVPGCPEVAADEVLWNINAASREHGVNPNLVWAVIYRESSFAPCAVSKSGALGLMQLKPGTAADMGVRDPFDPRQNIDGGARYLRKMLDRYDGDVRLALSAYHAGPTTVDTHRGMPPIRATYTYVADVLRLTGLPPDPEPTSD